MAYDVALDGVAQRSVLRDVPAATAKGRRTRARLLNAGRKVLEEKGYFDATVGEIAKRSGVALGSFYHHFPNKDHLFLLLLEDLVERMYASTSGSWQKGATHPSLVEATRRYLQTYHKNRRMISALLQMAAVVPASADGWWHLRMRVYGRMQRYLEMDPDPINGSSALYATALGSMVDQYAFHWYVERTRLDRDPPTVDEAAEILGRIWYRAIYDAPEEP